MKPIEGDFLAFKLLETMLTEMEDVVQKRGYNLYNSFIETEED